MLLIEDVTDGQLDRFGSLIYEKTGIRISSQKKTLLSNRLRRRLRATGIEDYEAYFKHLLILPDDDKEWDAFLQAITTHETYLFRDMSQWDWFRDDFLKDFSADVRAGKRQKKLRIWSAACSTGDEAHTIASCIAEKIMGVDDWKIEIVGTDIGIEAVNLASAGEFGERAMSRVPETIKRRFFSRLPDQKTWKAKDNLRRWLRFTQHNLLDRLNEQPFDLVFLKNVLIYFDAQSKEKVMRNLKQVMAPGAYLVTSSAEGVSDLLKDMDREAGWRHRMPLQRGDTK